MLSIHKQQIENFVVEMSQIKRENCDLVVFKDSMSFILQEGLRYALKQSKSTKLGHALRNLNPEDEAMIRKAFEEVGLHPKS